VRFKLDNLGFHGEVVSLLVRECPVKPKDTTSYNANTGNESTNQYDDEITGQGIYLLTGESVVIVE
jgi:hypothetical protein